jgi:hypothetical protein
MELFEPSSLMIFWSLLMLILICLWIYTIVDILKADFEGSNDKLIWILLVILVPFIGVLLYFIIGRKNKIKINQH